LIDGDHNTTIFWSELHRFFDLGILSVVVLISKSRIGLMFGVGLLFFASSFSIFSLLWVMAFFSRRGRRRCCDFLKL
jgi:hypothetical protein